MFLALIVVIKYSDYSLLFAPNFSLLDSGRSDLYNGEPFLAGTSSPIIKTFYEVFYFKSFDAKECAFRFASLATLHETVSRLLVVSLLAISGLQLNPGIALTTNLSTWNCASIDQPTVNTGLLQHVALQSSPADDHCFLHGENTSMLNFLDVNIGYSSLVSIIKSEITTNIQEYTLFFSSTLNNFRFQLENYFVRK